MEPSPLSDGNNLPRERATARTVSLQWSRRLSATETMASASAMAERAGLASMEPSPLSDGNAEINLHPTTKAALQWSRRLSATETITIYEADLQARIRALQWSRRLSATETRSRNKHSRIEARASMEPSPLSDGNDGSLVAHGGRSQCFN